MNCVYVMIVVAYSFEVIIRDNYPLSKCDKTGYEVELLLQAFSIYSLNEGSEYSITCELSDDTTNSRLTSENVIAIGGISISSSMMRDGIRFSYPTYGSGLNILVNKQESASVWKIFKVFTVELWIVIIFSPLMLGVTS